MEHIIETADGKRTVDTDKEGIKVAAVCNWNGKLICETFLNSLTDANFHALRKFIANAINESNEFKTKLQVEG